MSNMLQQLLGGPGREQYQDFVNRYEQGPPHEGYSDDEVLDRYEQVSEHVPPDVYEQSAYEAFARMSAQECRQFAQYLRQQARQQNTGFQDLDQDGIDDRAEQDPHVLAQVAGRMHRQQPGMFGQVVSGGRVRPRGHRKQPRKQKSPLDNPMAEAALAGIAAIAVKKMM